MKILFLKGKRSPSGIEGSATYLFRVCKILNKLKIPYLVLYNGYKDIYFNLMKKKKIKQGNKSIKFREKILLKKNIFFYLYNSQLTNFLPKNDEVLLFTPCVYINYLRSYYHSDDFMLTVDKNLTYRDIINNKLGNFFIEDNYIIIELKINDFNLLNFYNKKFDLSPIPNLRHSKFVRARTLFNNIEYF